MPDKPHRSRVGWRDMSSKPEEDDLVPGMPFHWHRLPKWIVRCVVGLFVLGSLNLAGLALSLVYDVRQQQYIEGRGEYRDREAARMEQENEERNRKLACAMADQFPEGGWLDRLRDAYDCGPGIPISQLPPEEQKELANRRSNVAPAPVAPLSPFGTPIVPDSSSPAPQREAAQPAQPAPEPSPEPGPPVPPSTVTDLVCGVVDACP